MVVIIAVTMVVAKVVYHWKKSLQNLDNHRQKKGDLHLELVKMARMLNCNAQFKQFPSSK